MTCSSQYLAGPDIRLIINQLQMRRLTKQTFDYDDIKGLSKKDVDMGPFTAVDKLCSADANRLTVGDRLNLVFQDADIIPLFIQVPPSQQWESSPRQQTRRNPS